MDIKRLKSWFILLTLIYTLLLSAKCDTNGSIEKEFNEFDINGDGFIDAQEIRIIKVSVTLQELHQFFWEIDVDSSGTISLSEYSAFVTNNSHYVE